MTLQEARDMESFYIAAEKQVLNGQSISKGDRTWTRADLAEIRKGRREWSAKVQQLSRVGGFAGPSVAEF